MEIGINEEDFLDEVDDFGTDDQAQDIDPQNQNKDDISTSQTTDEPQLEEDFITSLLKSRGIEDRSKIKFEMEEGSIAELDLFGKQDNEEIPIEGYGIYSKQIVFQKAQYIKDYLLPINDNSTKITSTEWVHKLLPKGSIIMFNKLLFNIPEGWVICDGQNNTPNLTENFIKDDNTSEWILIYIMKII